MKSILLKLTLIVSLCFFANLSYGQTKEETIQWLNDHGSRLLNLTTKMKNAPNIELRSMFLGFDGKYIALSYSEVWYVNGKFDSRYDRTWKVEPKSILFQDVETLEINEKAESFVLKTAPNTVTEHATLEGEASFLGGGQKKTEEVTNVFFYHYGKQQDVKRVLKAILHLAKLSGAKPLPAVTENTF